MLLRMFSLRGEVEIAIRINLKRWRKLSNSLELSVMVLGLCCSISASASMQMWCASGRMIASGRLSMVGTTITTSPLPPTQSFWLMYWVGMELLWLEARFEEGKGGKVWEWRLLINGVRCDEDDKLLFDHFLLSSHPDEFFRASNFKTEPCSSFFRIFLN